MSGLRPWQRPPFQPGHELTLKHGVYSPRKVEPVAAALLEQILTNPNVTYLSQPEFRPALVAWAQAEAKVILIEEWLSGMSIESAAESDKGKTSPLELLRKWESTAMTHRARLGLDPLSRARLGRDVAATQVDVVQLLTKQRTEAEAAVIEVTAVAPRKQTRRRKTKAKVIDDE